jgi:hypothetical protein
MGFKGKYFEPLSHKVKKNRNIAKALFSTVVKNAFSVLNLKH